MPNPSMRAAREQPNPVFTTDQNGNRVGDRPRVGPADPRTIHAALQAQEQLAKAPRPVAQEQVGATPADNTDNPTRDLSLQTAATRLAARAGKVANAIDSQSQ